MRKRYITSLKSLLEDEELVSEGFSRLGSLNLTDQRAAQCKLNIPQALVQYLTKIKSLSEQEQERQKKAEEGSAKDNIEKRKSGVGGGVKSALGGDVIGMRGKKGETPEEKRQRQDMNKKYRGDFAKKKVQQTGNAAKSAVGKTFSALTKQGKSGEDVQAGSESGNVSGGSEYVSRTKRD